MKPRNLFLAGTAAGVVLGGLAWLITRELTDVGEMEPLHFGDPFPRLRGMTLAGEPLTVPDDLQDRIAVLVVADNYDARFEVEAWGEWVRHHYGDRPDFSVYEVALISGIGPLMRRAIDAAMIRATPPHDQSHVLTVYGDLRAAQRRLGLRGSSHATLFILDKLGRLAWRTSGHPSPELIDSLEQALATHGIV